MLFLVFLALLFGFTATSTDSVANATMPSLASLRAAAVENSTLRAVTFVLVGVFTSAIQNLRIHLFSHFLSALLTIMKSNFVRVKQGEPRAWIYLAPITALHSQLFFALKNEQDSP